MSAYARVRSVFSNKNTKIKMASKKVNRSQNVPLLSKQGLFALALVFFLGLSTMTASWTSAATLQEQINALSAENSQKQANKNNKLAEASSYQDAINRLQAEINAKQATINEHSAEIERLKAEIAAAEIELAKQRKTLGETIKEMYLAGEISTVEMLATSKDLSDFFDKQQYRESVQSKVKTSVDKITQLKLDLNTNKDKTEKLLAEQQKLKSDLLAQKGEQDHLLALNQGERNNLDQQIRENSSKIADLRRQQIAANAKFSGSGSIPDTSGYPWANHMGSSWTHAGSGGYPNDIDPWGMYKRQCVSYTAWKTWKTHGYMPYWGGHGTAKYWDDNAIAAGIPVDGNPRAGDIAISNSGTWGHAMYVESVNGNGTINISQYNVNLTGTYSEATISRSGLVFIHF